MKFNRTEVLFVAPILCVAFFIIGKKLGLTWLEMQGIFITMLGLAVSVWAAFKSIKDTEQASINGIKQELTALIEGIKRDKEEMDKSQSKDLEFIKQQATFLSEVIQEQNRINLDMARGYEQLSAAFAQSDKYTGTMKLLENAIKRIEELESANR
jgi:hypothetical protein